jgi:hypothetical protein
MDIFVPPDVVGAAVLADGVLAAGALVVVLLLDPQALAMTVMAGIAASRKDLLTSQLPSRSAFKVTIQKTPGVRELFPGADR